MNSELKKFIEEKLELDKSSFSEKYRKVQDKIEELKNVTRELESYLNAEISELSQPIRDIRNKIRMSYPNMNSADYIPEGNCSDIYVPFEIQKIKFDCTLSFLFDKRKYQSGIYYDEGKNTKIVEFLKPLFDKKTIEDHKDDWYGYQEISDKDEALSHFTNLIEAVKNLTPSNE